MKDQLSRFPDKGTEVENIKAHLGLRSDLAGCRSLPAPHVPLNLFARLTARIQIPKPLNHEVSRDTRLYSGSLGLSFIKGPCVFSLSIRHMSFPAHRGQVGRPGQRGRSPALGDPQCCPINTWRGDLKALPARLKPTPYPQPVSRTQPHGE